MSFVICYLLLVICYLLFVICWLFRLLVVGQRRLFRIRFLVAGVLPSVAGRSCVGTGLPIPPRQIKTCDARFRLKEPRIGLQLRRGGYSPQFRLLTSGGQGWRTVGGTGQANCELGAGKRGCEQETAFGPVCASQFPGRPVAAISLSFIHGVWSPLCRFRASTTFWKAANPCLVPCVYMPGQWQSMMAGSPRSISSTILPAVASSVAVPVALGLLVAVPAAEPVAGAGVDADGQARVVAVGIAHVFDSRFACSRRRRRRT